MILLAEAIYARQSLDKKDSISIEMQVELGKKRCEGNQINVYIDKGYSGKNTKRPDYIRMFQDIRDKKISRVIVYRLDRFSRSLIDFCLAWETMSKNHVEFVSVNENFDTSTPVGKAMVYIIMIYAQMEREVIGERIRDNYYSRTEEGRWPGGTAPFGFELCKKEGPGGKPYPSLEVNKDMAQFKYMIKQYIEFDYSLCKIRTERNEAKERTIRGKIWTNMALAKIFKNPAYVKADADVYRYFKELGIKIINPLEEFDGKRAALLIGKSKSHRLEALAEQERNQLQLSLASWEGVLDSEIWLAVQEKLKNNMVSKRNGTGKYTWLSGVLKCGYCQKAIVPIVRKTSQKTSLSPPLYCSGHMQHGCAHTVNMRLGEIEEQVAAALMKVLDECNEEPVEETVTVISNRDKIELMELEEKIQKLISSIATGILKDAALKYVNAEIEKLSKKREEILLNPTEQKKAVYRKKINFLELMFDERKLVVKNFIKRVLIYEQSFCIEG